MQFYPIHEHDKDAAPAGPQSVSLATVDGEEGREERLPLMCEYVREGRMIHMSPEPPSREGVEITRSEGAPSLKGEAEPLECQRL